MSNENYTDYVARRVREHGDKFSEAGLAPKFRQSFNTGSRVRVRFSTGEELTGTIGATTGCRPCFLLMRRRSDRGSSWTLSERDEITAVRVGRVYVPVAR